MEQPDTMGVDFIQSDFGARGNFELVVASLYGGLVHWFRDNDAQGLPWHGPSYFASGFVNGVSLLQSRTQTGSNGDLEVLATVRRSGTGVSRLYHYRRQGGSVLDWAGPDVVDKGVRGNPSLIELRSGPAGRLALVSPLADGGMAYYVREPGSGWRRQATFATEVGTVDAVGLVENQTGNLELVARLGSNLLHFFRDSAGSWHGPTVTFFDAAAGVMGFVQSNLGAHGNFELVTPLAAGGLAHFYRDNDAAGFPWQRSATLGSELGAVSSVALIQSNFGEPGNLELVAQTDNGFHTYFRSTSDWHKTGEHGMEPTFDHESQGLWQIPYDSGVTGIHASQLHTGKVLFFTYVKAEGGSFQSGTSSVLDPDTGEVTVIPTDEDLFCAGQSFLSDGRLLVAGGFHTSIKGMHLFTPQGGAGSWQGLAPMPEGRWYPTLTVLPNGDVLILSGTVGSGAQVNPFNCAPAVAVNPTYSIYNSTSGLGPRHAVPFLAQGAAQGGFAPYSIYPFVFVLPDGRLFVHGSYFTKFLDVGDGSWEDGPPAVRSVARTYPNQGTCVLLPLEPPGYTARILVMGGAGNSCPTPIDVDTPATATCELLDLGAAEPRWAPAPSMNRPRVMPDSVLLPDGTVLVVNGSSTGFSDFGSNPVFEAEIYDPRAGGPWRLVASKRVPRLYHATAMLLPDGRVLSAGQDEEFNPPPYKYPELRCEVFTPPYLLRGDRPLITGGDTELSHGASFEVETPDARTIETAALLAPGAVTHSFNMNQRFVGLNIQARATTSLTLEAPPNANVAPPGQYMLFLVNEEGVPSVARFIHLS